MRIGSGEEAVEVKEGGGIDDQDGSKKIKGTLLHTAFFIINSY